MPLPKAFKTDESFLEKVAIGATGTKRIFDDLKCQGHAPIELERGSMSFKIWKAIKIKRVRVPDILCLYCGRRVESRAKTKMEISMSHSRSIQERGWDFGLDDSDLIAFVHVDKTGTGPVDYAAAPFVQYVPVKALRDAWKKGLTKTQRPKGAEEGFEMRVTWPAAVSSSEGVVEGVDDTRLRYRKESSSRPVTIRLDRQGTKLVPLVKMGDRIHAHQIIASVVPTTTTWPCAGGADIQLYLRLTKSSSLSDRYTAAKALTRFRATEAEEALVQLVRDSKEHIFVRLDAAAGLMRTGHNLGKQFLAETLEDEYLENRLEAVIVLGEVGTPEAAELLSGVLRNPAQHAEIRAGAAWALGELGAAEVLPTLIDSFMSLELVIKVEAARALAKLARRHLQQVLDAFPASGPEQRPGIAWALSRSGGFTIDQLLPTLIDEDSRQWVAYIVGTQQRDALVPGIEALARRDPEVYFAATVLWKIIGSWIYGLEEY